MKTNKLATPLRAEPKQVPAPFITEKVCLYDANDKLICICPNEEAAAAIVALSEDAKRLRAALERCDKAYKFDDKFDKTQKQREAALQARAALAAGDKA